MSGRDPFTDRKGLVEWAETGIWPSDRDAFVTWCENQPNGWAPPSGWGAFAQFCVQRPEQLAGPE